MLLYTETISVCMFIIIKENTTSILTFKYFLNDSNEE